MSRVVVDPASEAPATRLALRGLLRWWLCMALLGVALAATFMVGSVETESNSSHLTEGGARTAGTVIAAHRGGFILDSGRISVHYEVAGRARQGLVHLNDASRRYRVGEQVTVIYDRTNPDHMSVSGEDNDPPVFVAAQFAGLFLTLPFLLTGIAYFVRWRRWRRTLRSHPWLSVSASFGQVGYGRNLREVVVLHDIDQVVTAQPGWGRWRPLVRNQVGVVWVAAGERTVLLAPVGGAPLLLARWPHSEQAAEKLRQAVEQGARRKRIPRRYYVVQAVVVGVVAGIYGTLVTRDLKGLLLGLIVAPMPSAWAWLRRRRWDR